MDVLRVLLVLLTLVVSGCASPATPEGTTSQGDDADRDGVDNNPLVKVVTKVDPSRPIHLLQTPATSRDAVGAGEPLRSPFEGTALTFVAPATVEWTFTVNETMTLDGTANWTVWVEVPDGLYGDPLNTCPWDFSLNVQTERSSSSIGTSPSPCPSDTGPATPGTRRLDGDAQSSFLRGMVLLPGDTVTLTVGTSLLNPNNAQIVALGGVRGRDSQLVLDVEKPSS